MTNRLVGGTVLFGVTNGIRAAENQRAAYEAELSFYGQVFGFEPADGIPRLPIDNL